MCEFCVVMKHKDQTYWVGNGKVDIERRLARTEIADGVSEERLLFSKPANGWLARNSLNQKARDGTSCGSLL